MLQGSCTSLSSSVSDGSPTKDPTRDFVGVVNSAFLAENGTEGEDGSGTGLNHSPSTRLSRRPRVKPDLKDALGYNRHCSMRGPKVTPVVKSNGTVSKGSGIVVNAMVNGDNKQKQTKVVRITSRNNINNLVAKKSDPPFYLHEPNMTADDRVKKLFTSKGSADDGTDPMVTSPQVGKDWREENLITTPRPEPARRFHLDIQINGENPSGHRQVITAEVHQSSSDDCLSEISDPVPDYDEDGTNTVDTGLDSCTKREKMDTDATSCITEDTVDQLLSTVSTDEGIYHGMDEDTSYEQTTTVKVYIKTNETTSSSEAVYGGKELVSTSQSTSELLNGSKVPNKSSMTSAILSAASTPSGALKITIIPNEEQSTAAVPPPPPPPPPPVPPPYNDSNVSDSSLRSDEVDLKNKLLKKSLKNGVPAFIPPTFTTPPPDSDMNIKPSEYLKKVAHDPRGLKDSGQSTAMSQFGQVKSGVARFLGFEKKQSVVQATFMKRSVSETHLNHPSSNVTVADVHEERRTSTEKEKEETIKSSVQTVKSFLSQLLSRKLHRFQLLAK